MSKEKTNIALGYYNDGQLDQWAESLKGEVMTFGTYHGQWEVEGKEALESMIKEMIDECIDSEGTIHVNLNPMIKDVQDAAQHLEDMISEGEDLTTAYVTSWEMHTLIEYGYEDSIIFHFDEETFTYDQIMEM